MISSFNGTQHREPICHQEMETLVGIARLPEEYIKLRKKDFLDKYTPVCKSEKTVLALKVMLGYEDYEEQHPKVQATVSASRRLAEADERAHTDSISFRKADLTF